MRNSQNSRFWEIIGGLLLLFVGLSSIAGNAFFAFMLMGVGAWLLYRQWQQNEGTVHFPNLFNQQPREDEEAYYEPEEAPRQTGAEKVYAHALRAVERAGLNPDEVRVLPVDVGVMVFRGDNDPEVCRTQPVSDDADYIQPFVQLRLPTRAVGKIKFEIIDSDGQLLFVHEDIHHLERGRNLVTPKARLPIHDAQVMYDKWQLRISADGMVLASHAFEWQESSTRVIRRHITEDGEISNELRASLAENRLGKMSLDELLEFQEDEEPRQQRRR
ncbi:MAG: hypothetical protein JNJ78_12855 [Anaerolineae bacterium]|nr:hypothetical protein [Anaerolineae bacterium]